MNRLFAKRIFGFTVIELMIVLVIVAVLLALAYPSYIQYARKAKRGDAQQILMNWAVNQEIWRSNNPAYAGDADIPVPNSDHYSFSASNISATTYTLTATALGGSDQNNDTAKDGTSCSSMILDQNGQKLEPACWQ